MRNTMKSSFRSPMPRTHSSLRKLLVPYRNSFLQGFTFPTILSAARDIGDHRAAAKKLRGESVLRSATVKDRSARVALPSAGNIVRAPCSADHPCGFPALGRSWIDSREYGTTLMTVRGGLVFGFTVGACGCGSKPSVDACGLVAESRRQVRSSPLPLFGRSPFPKERLA